MFKFQMLLGKMLLGATAALMTSGTLVETCALARTPAGKTSARLIAGAGKATIDLPASLLPIDQFTALLDPLEVRVLMLDDGQRKAAIALIDQTSLGGHDLAAMQAVVAKATGAAADDVLVVASYTFSAPHMFAANPPPGMTAAPDEAARARQYVAHAMAALERAASAAGACSSAQPLYSRNVANMPYSTTTVYEFAGDADTWKIGATWDVADFLTLRAKRSRDFRAPTLDELFRPQATSITSGFFDYLPAAANPAQSPLNTINITTNFGASPDVPMGRYKAQMFMNVSNVFNVNPPVAGFWGNPNPGQFGEFVAGDDVIGRYFTFGIRGKF